MYVQLFNIGITNVHKINIGSYYIKKKKSVYLIKLLHKHI